MSGHSHWAGIKHKKGLADAKRSKAFSKLSKEITIAAKEGPDPNANVRLRSVIEKAKDENMPADNIDRAIKRATGEGAQLEDVLFEGYGPGGIAILIQGITDNKNRAVGEIKQIFSRHNGKFVEGGAVQWMFERKGVLTIIPPENISQEQKEHLELTAIEAGAQDLYWRTDGLLDVYVAPSELMATKTHLQEQGHTIESASLDWVPKEHVSVNDADREKAERLFESLDESDVTQDIYSTMA